MSVNGIGGGANNALYQQMLKRAQGADAAQGAQAQQRAGGAYNEADYLRELNDRLDARVVGGVWNGKDEFGSEKGSTVMVHPDFLRVMHDDPAVGAEYEAKINSYAKSDAEGRKRLEAQGYNINSSGAYINEKGEMNSYMSVSKAYGGDDKVEMTKTTKKKDEDEKTPKELMEEMLERIQEKRLEEKRQAERAAEEISAEMRVTGNVVDTVA